MIVFPLWKRNFKKPLSIIIQTFWKDSKHLFSQQRWNTTVCGEEPQRARGVKSHFHAEEQKKTPLVRCAAAATDTRSKVDGTSIILGSKPELMLYNIQTFPFFALTLDFCSTQRKIWNTLPVEREIVLVGIKEQLGGVQTTRPFVLLCLHLRVCQLGGNAACVCWQSSIIAFVSCEQRVGWSQCLWTKV